MDDAMSDRRAAITADIVQRTGIDDQMIERLVVTFYERVLEDRLLRPIFKDRVSDWPEHLRKMCAFWSSVALMSGRYHGQPMQKHAPLPIDGRHFDRWLALFVDTAEAVCPPEAATHFIERARNIAESLELGIASSLGIRLKKNERLIRPDDEVRMHDRPQSGIPTAQVEESRSELGETERIRDCEGHNQRRTISRCSKAVSIPALRVRSAIERK